MDQLKKLVLSLPVAQRWTIALCALAIGGGLFWFSHWQRESGFRPLYGSLSPEDASAMAQKLREGGVEYRIAENGTMLMVPEDRVPELRLEMAGLGLPKTGRIGFEIFDKTNFGITDFAEHVNYRRAVEGELERSIMALAEVQQARVHVTLPKESVFTEARESAKASVLVGLKPGMRLDPQNVVAIENLVSSAVEGLSPQSVSVVDMRGTLLNRPRKESPDGDQISEAALDYRQAIEHELTAKINNTLEPLLGADRFRTGVSADVDMTSGEQSEETFDPTKSVMVTSQRTEDTNSNTHVPAGGQPGTASNLPQPPRPAGTTTGSARKTESVTYQSSRTTKHTKLPLGSVKRLSVAVLVDNTVKWEGQGPKMHRVLVPPDPEKLKTIQGLVSTLVGLNTQRGDQITVETLPFDTTLNMEPPGPPEPRQDKKPAEGFSLEAIKNKPLLWGGGAAGGVVLIMLIGVMLGRRKGASSAVEVTHSLPPASSRSLATTAPNSQPMEGDRGGNQDSYPGNRLPALLPSRTEVLLTQLQDSGKNSPELWAGILRTWLSEEETG